MPCTPRWLRYNVFTRGNENRGEKIRLDVPSTVFLDDQSGILSRNLSTHGNKI